MGGKKETPLKAVKSPRTALQVDYSAFMSLLLGHDDRGISLTALDDPSPLLTRVLISDCAGQSPVKDIREVVYCLQY